MKKVGVLFILILCLSLVAAQNKTEIEQGISCLEDKIADCTDLTIPEISFALLSPISQTTKTACKTSLNSKKDSKNCWPKGNCNIKDTALAVLALSQNGENTDSAESWLLNQNKTPTDLIWYLQQNSDTATTCTITYSGNSYEINVAENKKIDSPAGECLKLSQSEFWLQISPDCYDTEFKISCRADFLANLFYKNANSPKFFILSEKKSAPQYGEITLKVNSKCFGTTSCDYEGSLWASLALQQTGHNVDAFVPYLIAMAESNTQYLPNAFIYMLTSKNEYATRLIQQITPQNYWVAGTVYNRFYDTALALLALGTSQEQTANAEKELLFSQSADGCWGTIRDTAIVLWALAGLSTPPSPSVENCETAGFFCIPRANCPEDEQLGNYFCPDSLSEVCCKNENLETCEQMGGVSCGSDEQCKGATVKSSDNPNCCIAGCEPKKSECEKEGYTCATSCSENQEEVNYKCNTGVCCKLKIPASSEGSSIIWILIVGILIVGGIISYLQRDKLKLLYFKIKNKFKKGEPSPAPPTPPHPPKPGFPPIRRAPPRPPMRKSPRESPSDVFKKLKEMTK